MTNPRQSLGQRGEAWVAERLRAAGYTILTRNWRTAGGELDIVARRGAELVFVEVRTRRGPVEAAVAAALDSVNARKRARLAALAEAYLAQLPADETPLVWRIDVAAVGCEGGTFRLEVIRDATDW